MNWSLTIGRIAGTNIRLHVTFLIFLIWIGTADYLAGGPSAAVESIVFILLVFLCVTLHEFGHIAMARRFGVNTPEVILSPIGGIAAMERMPDKPGQELLVAIAGPLVNVVIALLLMAALGLAPLTTTGFEQGSLAERLLLVNIMLVAFNLIPAFPMDGGRVLRALLAMKMGARRATAIAARIGQGFAVLFFVLGLLLSPILMVVGIFIYFAARAEEEQATFTGIAARLTVRDAMEPSPMMLDAAQPVADAIDALLTSPQKEFPVVDGTGRIVGLLDRDAMIMGLRDKGAGGPVGDVMRGCVPVRPEVPLPEAYIRMRQRGAAAEIVVDAQGRVLGMLTTENVAEMMLVESARPGWRFRRR